MQMILQAPSFFPLRVRHFNHLAFLLMTAVSCKEGAPRGEMPVVELLGGGRPRERFRGGSSWRGGLGGSPNNTGGSTARGGGILEPIKLGSNSSFAFYQL